MADFRQIHTRIWKDNWFCDLPDDGKLLFIYLFSNERASVSGIYELPLKYMVFESGIDRERVEELLAEFDRADKVRYDYENGIVWVINLRKYNESASPKVKIRLYKDVAAIPDSDILHLYCKAYKIQYPYSIDTTSKVGERDRDRTETETDTEKETDTEESPPPPPDDDPQTGDLAPFEKVFVEETSLPLFSGGPDRWFEGLKKIKDSGATPDDFRQAIREQSAAAKNGRTYNLNSPASFVNATLNIIAKRNAKPPDRPPVEDDRIRAARQDIYRGEG
jgi:hypothetical protein